MAEKRTRRSTGPVTEAPRQAPVPAPDDPGGAHAKGYAAEPGPSPAVPADGPVPLANPPADPGQTVNEAQRKRSGQEG